MTLEEFVPQQGRTVVYGFRNPSYWQADADYRMVKREGIADGVEPFIYRPAQIVRVWTKDGMKTVNLVVFLDGGNDRALSGDGGLMVWKTSAVIGSNDYLAVGNEHYLPRVPEGYSGS